MILTFDPYDILIGQGRRLSLKCYNVYTRYGKQVVFFKNLILFFTERKQLNLNLIAAVFSLTIKSSIDLAHHNNKKSQKLQKTQSLDTSLR